LFDVSGGFSCLSRRDRFGGRFAGGFSSFRRLGNFFRRGRFGFRRGGTCAAATTAAAAAAATALGGAARRIQIGLFVRHRIFP
jgi:hypothetical protein